MQKKKMLQEFLGHRFLVFALFMLIFSGGLKAAEEEYQKKKFPYQMKNQHQILKFKIVPVGLE